MEYNKLSIFYLASTEKECFRLPFELSFEQFSITSRCSGKCSLHGRCLKGNLGKGVLGARKMRGAREEGERETSAKKPLFLPSRLLIMYAKITQLWMTSCQISLAVMHLFKSYLAYCFSFVFLKQEVWSEGTIKKSINEVVRWRKKVATMRGLSYEIQHKSIRFLLKVSCWTSKLACNVCRRNLKLQTLCWLSNWIQQSIQKNAGSRERRAELQRSTIRLILQSILLLK